jgi:ketosteroid isomerase-like protein
MPEDSNTRHWAQLTRGLLEAWNRRDLEALTRVFAADPVWKELTQEWHALIVHIARHLDNARAAAQRLAQRPG